VKHRLNSWLRAHRICNVCDSTSSSSCISLYAQSLVTEGMVNQCHAKWCESILLVRDCIASDSDSINGHTRVNGSLSNIVIKGTFQKGKRNYDRNSMTTRTVIVLENNVSTTVDGEAVILYLVSQHFMLQKSWSWTWFIITLFWMVRFSVLASKPSVLWPAASPLLLEFGWSPRATKWSINESGQQIYDLNVQLSMVSPSITRGAGLETE